MAGAKGHHRLQAATLAFLLLGRADPGRAQSPTGAITGIVTDAAGAALAGAQVSVTHRDTRYVRTVATSNAGTYNASALSPAEYTVSAEVKGFKRVIRSARVEAGTTTTVDLTLEIGEILDTVTVRGAVPLIRQDHHVVSGVVTREQIENLPLNGRNFLELAKLEPGVTSPVRGAFNRTFVPSLGSGLQTIPRVGFTRTTVDGASIHPLGTIGTSFQVSQEVVQEFQMSTVNFDQGTSPTAIAAVNIVTRSGGNQPHGSGFTFYRDHNLAAYPGLGRDAFNPDPFFRRLQVGAGLGGPIRHDRAFFFVSYERNDQRGIISVLPSDPEFASLAGLFPSPSLGHLFSVRVDGRLGPNHHAFARYTLDRSYAFFSGVGVPFLPSAWSRFTGRLNQGLAGVTSVLSSNVVNELRLSRFRQDGVQDPVDTDDCPIPCFGLGAPRIAVSDAGVTFGGASSASSDVGHRYQVSDSLVWQRGRHTLRVGFEWEHTKVTTITVDAGQVTLWSPAAVRQRDPTIPLPASFDSVDDVLALPLRSFQTVVGPAWVPQRGFRPDRVLDLYRVHVGDAWRAGSRLTVNAGVAWSYEPNALNHDLTKPALLTPILGADGLTGPRVRRTNFSPLLGFAWTASGDGKTVLRGGAGRYFDPVGSTNSVNLANERSFLSPLGAARMTISGGSIVHEGRPLDFPQRPTPFTGAQLIAILPGKLAEFLPSFSPDNRDLSIRTIDFTKEGRNLYDQSYETPSAVHVSLGMQRELAHGFVASADAVWRRFEHTFISGIDYNRWNSAGGSVIPPCVGPQRNDVTALCSNRNIFFDTTIGQARYQGLLVRIEKRFGGRAQFLGSYALGSYRGTNGTGTGTAENTGGRVFGFNNDNWFENYGPLPTDQRHVLNLSGFVELPWRLQMAFSVSAYSRPPFSAYVAGMDFNGDGTQNDLLPGTRVNQFGHGLDKHDLERLLDLYNAQYAGRRTPTGPIAPPLTLPDDYAFDDKFFTQDLRVTRVFPLARGTVRLSLFGEVFNLLNTANLVGYNGNLTSEGFGQPTGRFTQVFGSGGPRAFQLGARVSF
jgi:Carboxypeptidase regulatory-like domain